MADLSREALFKSLDLFSDFSEEKAGDVCDIEERVDKYEDVLGTYLMKLSSRDLTEQDSETLNMLLHCIGNFGEHPLREGSGGRSLAHHRRIHG